MNEQLIREDFLRILRLLSSKDDLTQRDLSNHIGISLGKTNYLLKKLIKRGFISVKHFVERDGKFNKIRYFLTKEGLDFRLKLTYHFLKRKEDEYYKIREEWREIKNNHKIK